MSSIHRTWQTPDVFAGDTVPSTDALARSESAAQSRTAPDAQPYLIFHYVLVVYVFFLVSRIPDLLPWLRVGYLLLPIMLIGLVMTKRVRILLDVRTGRWLIGFTVWVAICVPFSFWPGGSFQTLKGTLQSLFLVAFLLAFVRSVRDVKRVLTVVGLATGTIAIASFISSAEIGNRQGVGGSESVSDPNYFALYLLVGLAFLCLTVSQGRGWVRICALALIPISLAGIARSGSRSGLIAFAAGIVMMLVYGSAKQRTIILWACLAGIMIAAFFLPQRLKTRFTDWLSPAGFRTLLTGQISADPGLSVAEGSTESRMYLLRRSLVMTAKHPLFGVGPGQFMDAEAADAKQHGTFSTWHQTHNLYTQMSSELGIPGLILYAGALFGSYRGLSGIRRRGPTRQIRQMALFLQTGYFALMVGAFFLSLGYGGLPVLLMGVSTAFKLAVRRYKRENHTQILRPEMSVAV
jgi:O-antigen ligase